MEREFIGQGREHEVYASRIPGWVLKKPRPTLLISNLAGYGVDKVREELEETKQAVSSSKILRVPETRVFRFRRGYVIAQKFIKEDQSVGDIGKSLDQEGQKLMSDRYYLTPHNFMTNQGRIYFVDYSYGISSRVLQRLGFSFDSIVSFRANLARFFRGTNKKEDSRKLLSRTI